jgi:hypothetical protein
MEMGEGGWRMELRGRFEGMIEEGERSNERSIIENFRKCNKRRKLRMRLKWEMELRGRIF